METFVFCPFYLWYFKNYAIILSYIFMSYGLDS